MGFVHRQMLVDGADDFFVSIGAVYAEYSGVVIFNLGGIGAQATRDDDPAILVDCLSDGLQALSPGFIDEAAGVYDDDACIFISVDDVIPVEFKLGENTL
jgi:hypothetical protein